MSLRLDNNKLKTKEIELSQKILKGYIDQFGYNESDILKKLRNEINPDLKLQFSPNLQFP